MFQSSFEWEYVTEQFSISVHTGAFSKHPFSPSPPALIYNQKNSSFAVGSHVYCPVLLKSHWCVPLFQVVKQCCHEGSTHLSPAMRLPLLCACVMLVSLSQCRAVSFPEDEDPINVVDYHCK